MFLEEEIEDGVGVIKEVRGGFLIYFLELFFFDVFFFWDEFAFLGFRLEGRREGVESYMFKSWEEERGGNGENGDVEGY